MQAWIDHITVTAPSLAAGVAHVHAQLGVTPPAGGEHPRMGTHNCLLRLGESMFLEVIAVNPDAPAPARPRWFELDRMPPDAPPRLAMWVARSSDIRAAAAGSPMPLGALEPMSRGNLNWLITIPEDGSLPGGGIAPSLIQWQANTHPAANMAELGCSLEALDAVHPDADRIRAMLDKIGFEGPLSLRREGGRIGLTARILTPHGLRTLA